MKNTGRRSFVLYFLTAAFVGGMIFFLYSLFTHGGAWAMQPYNQHIAAEKRSNAAGSIFDCNGNVLLQTKDGKRRYNPNAEIRKATLHTVGDSLGYISTGVQPAFRSQLMGYNPITGLTAPTGKKRGSDITLTLDSHACEQALRAMGSKRGAAIMYNYKTGDIICKISTPTFDPENVPSDIEKNSRYKGAYVDRAFSSSFTPGSIFKVVTSASAIENFPNWQSLTFNCKGETIISGNRITCLEHHGKIGIKRGMAVSCNVAFAELAVKLGKNSLTKTADEMGFNKQFYVDGIPLSKSVFDVKNADKGALGWAGIGQNTTLANPCHMMMIMGAIANGGTPVQPKLIQNKSLDLNPLKSSSLPRMMDEKTAAQLKSLLRNDVTYDYGDDMFPSGMKICAKTGTAEVGKNKKDTGWIVGFSANPNTPFAFAVVVEEGGFGLSSAGPVAIAMLQSVK